MKKILSLLLAAIMLLSLSVTVFAAETEIMKTDAWEISTSSDQGNRIGLAFDDNASTYWHTYVEYTEDGKVKKSDQCPHTITVDFGEETLVSGWVYTPRTDNGSGTITKYNIYASQDGKKFNLIYQGSFKFSTNAFANEPGKASWGDVNMRAIMIEATESFGGYGTAAEIDFLTGGTGSAIKDGIEYVAPENKQVKIPGTQMEVDSSWNFSASSDLGGTTINRAFDSSTATYWHTNYKSKDGAITSRDEGPFTITVDFGKETEVSGWLYTPRTDNATGTVLSYNISSSLDGKNFEKIYSGSFDYKMVASANLPNGASWGDKKM